MKSVAQPVILRSNPARNSGESLSHGHGRLAPAIIGLAFALIGIVLLAGAKPPLAMAGTSRPGKTSTEEQPSAGR